jgi:hypothetical protein
MSRRSRLASGGAAAALLVGAASAAGVVAWRGRHPGGDRARPPDGDCGCAPAPLPRPPAYVREAPEPFAWRCVEGLCSYFTACSDVVTPPVALTLRPRSATDQGPDLWLGGPPPGEAWSREPGGAAAGGGANGDRPALASSGQGEGVAPGVRVEMGEHFVVADELYQWVDFRGYSDWSGACGGGRPSEEKGGAAYFVTDRLRVAGRRTAGGGVTLRLRRARAGEPDRVRGFAVPFETPPAPPPPDEACRAEMAREGFAHPAWCFPLGPGSIVHDGGRRYRVLRAERPRRGGEGRVELALDQG